MFQVSYEKKKNKRFFTVELGFCWYDIWVGMCIDTKDKAIYICLLPCILLRIGIDETTDRMENDKVE